MSILEQIKWHWRHAFTIPRPVEWNDDDQALIEKLAAFVVRRGLSAPAMMILESSRPINFLGSQVLAFIGPFATLVFSRDEYDRFVRLLERRECVDLIMDAIAKLESETDAHE